jgi:Na+/H+-dicarboxylate symporter
MNIKTDKEGWSIAWTFLDYVGVVLIILVLAFALVVIIGLLQGISPLKLLQSIGDNGFRIFAPRGQRKK